ncbi:U3 small nucleolar ribonucleoprotein MPP10 [Hypsibius exemplaris]|uniref:U3 small nucleolar ribonucleoprotein protein MPP10 n=1 Tax=Hypsibius exemplaris TaxID=2072580 RepID=A0A1W0WLD8_HYPEX|nr:U3 small nucleolar ribonucleoprotein MPP10 [Hypsibius exemplaris]
MATSQSLAHLITAFRTLTEQPTAFLTKDANRADAFKTLSKVVFDHSRTSALDVPHSAALSELLTGAEFDDEQVWQQLELDNRLNIDSTVKRVASVLVQGDGEFFRTSAGSPARTGSPEDRLENEEESGIESHNGEDSDVAEHQFEDDSDFAEDDEKDVTDDEDIAREDQNLPEGDSEEDDEEDDLMGEAEKETDTAQTSSAAARRAPGPASELDDNFFRLSEMNEFLLEDERRGNRRSEREIDYFAEDDDDEERDEDDYKYDDFFDPPPGAAQLGPLLKAPVRAAEKSTFEKRQEKLKDRIKEMEEEAVSEKPWQLGGEVSATKRPENSLLEEFLQFDHVMRQPPVITEEVSQKLEDLILQRIKDKAWDDVERKVKAKGVDPYEYKKKLVLEETKAKQSLSQIYEQEYLKKVAATDNEEEKAEHIAIRKSLSGLFIKLDALSNFHFVPKPVAPDIKIVNNLPTLVVEEVQPSTVATSQLLAPEEVQAKKKGELTGLTEASETDKNRSRRKKKLRQKIKGLHQKGKEEAAEKAAKKVEKAKTKGGSSGAFFDKLQDTVKAEQAAKTPDGKESKKRKKDAADGKSVKKFKL